MRGREVIAMCGDPGFMKWSSSHPASRTQSKSEKVRVIGDGGECIVK